MGNSVKVSIVMPVYNVECYLRECLDSVVNQTLKDIEIICINDGSTDTSLEILEEYAAKDNRIRIISKDNSGYGHTMNVGLDAATGEYIGVVETDDYVHHEMYEKLYALATARDLDVVKADFYRFTGDGEERKFELGKLSEDKTMYWRIMDTSDADPRLFKAAMMTWTGIYKREFLNHMPIRHHESPGASYQDNGFWFQVYTQAHRIMFIDEPLYRVRRDNPNSSINNPGKVYCICEEYDFIRRYLESDSQRKEKFMAIYTMCRYFNYSFTLERIANKFRYDFLHRFSADFRAARENGEIDSSLFSKEAWEKLNAIIEDPEEYYFTRYYYSARKNRIDLPSQRRLQELYSKMEVMEKKNISMQEEIKVLKSSLKAVQSSLSFRVGRVITYIPRKARSMFRLCKKKGFTYTSKLLMKKVKCIFIRPKHILPKTPCKRSYEYYASLDKKQYPDALREWYTTRTGKQLDLNNVRTLNEKIQWLKLYDSTKIKGRLSDKYLVRKWVEKKIGNEYLIPLLGVWDNFDEIDFSKLPNKFVLKANHGSGWNIIVSDKSKMNLNEMKKKFDEWMNTNFTFVYGLELHYSYIKPRIIAEQFLECDGDLYDYKVMCINGEPRFIWIDSLRYISHRRDIFDLNWNLMPFTIKYPHADKIPAKPALLDQMIELAKKLSKGFSFVRVDFYEVGGKLYFGEMTFTTCSGSELFNPDKYDLIYGDMICLPRKKRMINPSKLKKIEK